MWGNAERSSSSSSSRSRRSTPARLPSLLLQCMSYAAGNKCAATVGYLEYCSRCDAAKTKCVTCSPGRALVNGVCSRPCKLLFGIGCRACTATACTGVDAAYSQGRR